ncbi:TolC family protein [Candidatus Magnetaquicoccus inordinatus]|uniref:TolC family outer membrane protein n=1 Tax=Candidatus Magnetaquicoccus inordinatus TaxID=2496818 RepID=UPI00187D6ADC|nr:TolC family protein [Candidatus Magnetaquicoccus inordinatus]
MWRITARKISCVWPALLAIAVGFSSSPLLGAANPDVQTFWIAVDNGLARSPMIQRQEAVLRATREVDPQSRARLLPTVDVTASSVLDETTYYRRINKYAHNEPNQVGVRVNQPIFNFVNLLGREQSLPQIDGAVADLEYTRQDMVVRIATLISNWLEAREVYELSDSYTHVTARHARIVALRFKAGESTETEVHEADSRALQAEAARTNARNVMDKAAASFAEVTGELPPKQIVLPEFKWQEPAQFEERLAEMVESRADIRAARAKMESAAIATKMRRAEHAPTLRFTYTATRTWNTEMSGTGSSFKEDTDNQSSMLTLDVPIYSGGMITSRTRQAQAEWESLVADVDRLRHIALREAQEARMDVANLKLAIDFQERALRSNQKALAGLQDAFLAGTRTILELLDTQYETLTIQTNLVRSRYQHRLARIRLWAAMGWPLLPEHALDIVAESGAGANQAHDAHPSSSATAAPRQKAAPTPLKEAAAVNKESRSSSPVAMKESDLADPLHTITQQSPVVGDFALHRDGATLMAALSTPVTATSSQETTAFHSPQTSIRESIAPVLPAAPGAIESVIPSVSALTRPLLPESGLRPESFWMRLPIEEGEKVADAEGHCIAATSSDAAEQQEEDTKKKGNCYDGPFLVTPPDDTLPKMGWGPYYACIGIYPDRESLRPIAQALATHGVYSRLETARTWDNRYVLRMLVGPFADFTDLTHAREVMRSWIPVTAGWVRNRKWAPVLEEGGRSSDRSGVNTALEALEKTSEDALAAKGGASVADETAYQSSGPFYATLPNQERERADHGPRHPFVSEGPFYVHAGAYQTEEEREEIMRKLSRVSKATEREAEQIAAPEWRAQRYESQRDTLRTPQGTETHRVLSMPFASYEEALRARRAIQKETGIRTGSVDNPRWEDHQNCPQEALLWAADGDERTAWDNRVKRVRAVGIHDDISLLHWEEPEAPATPEAELATKRQ